MIGDLTLVTTVDELLTVFCLSLFGDRLTSNTLKILTVQLQQCQTE